MTSIDLRLLEQKDAQIEELKECLRYIVNMESCLLADAQAIAKNALENHEPVEPLFGDPGFPKVNHE